MKLYDFFFHFGRLSLFRFISATSRSQFWKFIFIFRKKSFSANFPHKLFNISKDEAEWEYEKFQKKLQYTKVFLSLQNMTKQKNKIKGGEGWDNPEH